jgi:hypothetical protein
VQFAMVAKVVGTGTLKLSGPKGLTVYLDARELDALPLKNMTLREGTHALVIVDQKSRERVKKSFVIKPDALLELRVERGDSGLSLVSASDDSK